MRRRHLFGVVSAMVSVFVMAFSPLVYAQQESSSNSYKVDQIFMGAGGELNACSSGPTGYCAKQSAGEIAAGHIAGNLFRANAGFNVNREPYIAFSASGTSDLGYLSEVGTASATGTFAVKTYLSQGYVVRITADPPTNLGASGHQIAPMTTPGGPSPGTEQFGMNLTANTLPITFGADPVQVPDNTFSFGTVDDDYNDTNMFTYNTGDVVASSTQSSGETDYTVSFIYDISDQTPNGTYVFNGTFVATSTY